MPITFVFLKRAAASLAVLALCGSVLVTSARAQGLIENFDDVTDLVGKGFALVNRSAPAPLEGEGDWAQGNPLVFESFVGRPESFIAADFTSVSGETPGTISNWLLTPALTLNNGDIVSFYTRTNLAFNPDRLEVRLSGAGDSANVGTTAESVGDFSTLLLTINPDLLPAPDPNGYPAEWTRYALALSGLPEAGATGRVGFRYFVTDAGAAGDNGDYIGLDSLRVGAAAPEPSALTLLLSLAPALYGAFLLSRRPSR